ncbi:MAG TPA: fasciclin domain-containing protein [Polyangiaceae bacterium]|nr:fasciclin domain-containing protein [Polyangiaceae bacterium]
MKKLVTVVLVLACGACEEKSSVSGAAASSSAVTITQAPVSTGGSRPLDPNNIVSVAVGSKDHTTLVSALKAADYVDSVATPGPFTVFAPTNAAFDKLPKGTVDTLMKPENLDKLTNVLKYHVAVSVYQAKDFKDGQKLAMANGAYVTFHVKDGKVQVNDANIVASIPASNGIVHVIDGVLQPPP